MLDSGMASSRQILKPLYCFGLCEAVTIDAGRVAELADGEVELVAAGHAPEVDDVGALIDDAR